MTNGSTEKNGFSGAGLERLEQALSDYVERGRIPGLVALVARTSGSPGSSASSGLSGEPHVIVVGSKAWREGEAAGTDGAIGGGTDGAMGARSPTPMTRDSIFRIASLTKPVTALAAMILVEDGVLTLGQSVVDLLPEMADRRVLVDIDSRLDETVKAEREISLEDLLTFKLGFGNVLAPPGTYPIQVAEEDLGLRTLGPPWPPPRYTPDEWIERFATLPLMYQPGERWLYNTGAQILGILIERAAGKSFEHFLRERVFDPLGMKDTHFSVPVDDLPRFTTAYWTDPATGERGVLDPAGQNSYWARPPSMPNGAAWLLSTVDDYWAFAQTLRNDGAYPGGRIVSEKSVKLMTADHLTRKERLASRPFLGAGSGWGFCMAVPASGSPRGEGVPARGAERGYGWNGGSGTTWRTDAETGLTGILFTQQAMTSPEPPEVFKDFWQYAYEALS